MTSKEVTLDFSRPDRTGLSETILCASKSIDQLTQICDQISKQEHGMLFTRLSTEQFAALNLRFPRLLDYDDVSGTAIYKAEKLQYKTPQVAVVTAGTSDVPIAREALRTLRFYGHPAEEINDVGVAGLWRLTERLDLLRKMRTIICIAGMDAALPTVLGGLVPGLIVAVPSSVGYGMVKGGETALNALLVSCASGLVVVNIDNGYGAACAALRALYDPAVS